MGNCGSGRDEDKKDKSFLDGGRRSPTPVDFMPKGNVFLPFEKVIKPKVNTRKKNEIGNDKNNLTF